MKLEDNSGNQLVPIQPGFTLAIIYLLSLATVFCIALFLSRTDPSFMMMTLACTSVSVLFTVILFFCSKYLVIKPLCRKANVSHAGLCSSEKNLRSILNSVPDIIYYKDPDGNYLGANSAFEECVGVYGDDLTGKTDLDFFPGEVANLYRMKDMEVMCSCMLDVYEEEISYPCGITKQVETIKVPYFDEQGALVGLIGICRDIEQRKELEKSLVEARNKAESATRARSEFLANMSHEIRTPMNGVVTMAEMICDQQLGHKAAECAVTIRDSSKILLGVLNDILDFSKIEEGKLDVNLQPFSCKKMVKDVIALYSNRADAKGIVLTYNYSAGIPQYACGDELRIRQILGNILSNAIKFCPEGAVEIEVFIKDDKWCFKISDTGIGMTEDQLAKVFDKFEQANSSIAQRFGGTGLGLSISKKLVELMGGELSVESEFGAGTVFTAVLPLTEANVDDVDVEIITCDDAVRIGARVLLADDSKFNKAAFCMFFEDKLGCSVDLADNGEIAVELAMENQYDMIFMDCHMPVMDGLDATRCIRMLNKDVPIIALTADIMPEVREECFEAGMNDFSVKPFDLSHLKQLVVKYSSADELDVKIAGTKKVLGVVIFDKEIYEGFFGSDKETLVETMKDFVDDTDPRVACLPELLAEENVMRLREEAHGMKGAFGMVGGMRLAGAFCELQNAATDNNLPLCKAYVEDVQEGYSSFRNEALAYLKTV